MQGVDLTAAQKEALSWLERWLGEWTDRIGEASRAAGSAEQANILAIDGPRGSGKTTVLQAFFRARESLEAKGLWVCQPLDCSLLLPGVEPSAPLLMHLGAQLEPLLRSEAQEEGKKELQKLRDIQETSLQGAEAYQALAVEHISSLGDYGHYITEALLKRIDLRSEVAKWLNRVSHLLKVRTIVVLLDDFDLVAGHTVRKLMRAMLDELRQQRLVFLLAADRERLEHLSWDDKAEIDDKTGRALLEKLIPSQNRVRLADWSLEDREQFNTQCDGRRHKLWDMVSPFAQNDVIQERLLKSLLPRLPRGLVNFYESLRREWREDPPGAGETLSEGRIGKFLGLLAVCRAEPLLARKLSSLPISDSVETLDFRYSETTLEQWRESVKAAREGFLRDQFSLPIPKLVALMPRSGVLPSGSQEIFEGAAAREDSLVYELWRRAPASRDPLRHDLQQAYPLRDGEAMDVPYWCELLLNWGFSIDRESKGPLSGVRHRIEFLESWPAAVERARRTRFQLSLSTNAVRDLFLDNSEVPWGCLLWMDWEVTGPNARGEVGWWTLMGGLREARDISQSNLLAKLMVSVRRVTGSAPKLGDARALEVLPDRVRGVILLLDALDRCPWVAGSSAGWAVATYLGLAAAFVRSAYVHARVQARLTARESLPEPQLWFLSLLEERSALEILKVTEDELCSRIVALLKDEWEKDLGDASDSLGGAARCYRDSTPYQAVRALFGLTSATEPQP